MEKIIAVLTIILLTSCAIGPTPEQLANAYYGRDMAPEECTSLVEPLVANALVDPAAAQFRHVACYKGFYPDAYPIEFGWVQVGEVNARNRVGGYNGFGPYKALLRDGAVIRACIHPYSRGSFSAGCNYTIR